MRIALTSIFVGDQRAALAFYTDVLGFARTTFTGWPGSPPLRAVGGSG